MCEGAEQTALKCRSEGVKRKVTSRCQGYLSEEKQREAEQRKVLRVIKRTGYKENGYLGGGQIGGNSLATSVGL